MPDTNILYEIQMPSGNVYKIVDRGARELLKELLNFHEWLGITTSEIDEGSTTNPVLIDGEEVTAVAGDVVSRSTDHKDFVFSVLGTWQNFGEMSGLGALAFKDSASGTVTAAGTISTPTFTGTEITSTGTITPEGTISAPTFTGSLLTSTGTLTPEGTISAPTFNGNSLTSTGTITPEGSISNVELNEVTITELKTVGSLASCTMPDFSVTNGRLIITDGIYISGTLPTGESKTVASTTVKTQPIFTGSSTNVSVTGTPTGTVSAPSFTGTEASVSVTGTPEGTISTPTFTGTPVTVTVE